MRRKKRKLSDVGVGLGNSKQAKKKDEALEQIVNSKHHQQDESLSVRDKCCESSDHGENQEVNVFHKRGMNDVFYAVLLPYLKWTDKLNLRLVSWYFYNLVTDNDISFRLWNIYLDTRDGQIPKLPPFFYKSETAIVVTFRKIGQTRTRKGSKYLNSLTDFLDSVNHRIKGVDMYVEDLDKLKEYFNPKSLHTIKIRDDDYNSFGECAKVCSLVKKSRNTLKVLHLDTLEFLDEEAECIGYRLKHKLPKLESVIFNKCHSSQLVASVLNRSNVCLKNLIVTGGQLSYLNDIQENMESLHTLEVISEFETEDKAVDGIKNLLIRCPRLKRLKLWKIDLDEVGLTGDEFPCLHYLEMINCTSSIALLQSILKNISPQVETLGFDHCKMRLNQDFKCNFPKLLDLYLYGLIYDSQSLWDIIKMAPKLQALRTQSEYISPMILKKLKRCQLKEITLDSNDGDYPELTNSALKLLGRNASSLEQVNFVRLYVDNMGTKPFSKLKKIVSRCSIFHLDVVLKICPNIEEIVLKDTDIQCQTASFPIHSLKKLEMCRCTSFGCTFTNRLEMCRDFPKNVCKILSSYSGIILWKS